LNEVVEQEIPKFFSKEELEELARESGFIIRKRNIDGATFIRLVCLNKDNLRKESLNDLTVTLRQEYDIEMTKQSLHKRFNEKAVLFLKMTLAKLLNRRINRSRILPLASRFKRILIKDSVCFQIDESLLEHYPGSGGSGSKASVRIQFEYDMLSGLINDLGIYAFNEQDATNSAATLDMTREGDLVIRDLAYMHLDALKGFIQRSVSFLCRLNTQTLVYQQVKGEMKPVNFSLIVKRMVGFRVNSLVEDVYIGKKEKLPVRLFIYLMPQQEYSERIRKAQKKAKENGRSLTKEYKARAALNLFITNVTDGSLTLNNAWTLYRMRWQIELVFKVWKSIWEIDEVKKVNKQRFECYILSKLITISLCWQLVWRIGKTLYRLEGKMLSFIKAFKTLRRYVADLWFFFEKDEESVKKYFLKFYETSRVNHLLETRGKQERSMELLVASLLMAASPSQEVELYSLG